MKVFKENKRSTTTATTARTISVSSSSSSSSSSSAILGKENILAPQLPSNGPCVFFLNHFFFQMTTSCLQSCPNSPLVLVLGRTLVCLTSILGYESTPAPAPGFPTHLFRQPGIPKDSQPDHFPTPAIHLGNHPSRRLSSDHFTLVDWVILGIIPYWELTYPLPIGNF